VIVVSPRNYFLYTPLLPAVATGTMEERSIVEPVRNLVTKKVRMSTAAVMMITTVSQIGVVSVVDFTSIRPHDRVWGPRAGGLAGAGPGVGRADAGRLPPPRSRPDTRMDARVVRRERGLLTSEPPHIRVFDLPN
jgi:hypothetical protein